MATLSNSIYDNLNREFNKASLALFNSQGEVLLCDNLLTLKRSKSRISTRWGITNEVDNNIPFNHAAILIRNKVVQLFGINVDSVDAGSINIDFDTED